LSRIPSPEQYDNWRDWAAAVAAQQDSTPTLENSGQITAPIFAGRPHYFNAPGEPALVSPWVPHYFFQTAGFWKDLSGIVHLFGGVQAVINTNGFYTITILPPEFRPRAGYAAIFFQDYLINGAFAYNTWVSIGSNGTIAAATAGIPTGSGASISVFLDQMSFRTDIP